MPLLSRSARLASALILLTTAVSCGGRNLGHKTARDLITNIDEGAFDKEEIYIDSVSQTGARDAVAEATLRAAFKFEKTGGKWVIREVRLGNRPWEDIGDILDALAQVKTDRTRKILGRVADAIDGYRRKNGALPEFADYIALSDRLSPDFMAPPIREDAWHRPLAASRDNGTRVRLVSPGPDGKLGTPDDIELVRTFPQ